MNKQITIIERCAQSEDQQDYTVGRILHKIIKTSDLLRIDAEYKECYYFDIDNFEWKVDINGKTIFKVLSQLFYERAELWYYSGSVEMAYQIAKVIKKFDSIAYRKKIIGLAGI